MFFAGRYAKSLEDELRAERAVTAQYNKALEEALELAREQDATLVKQREVIDRYEHIIETKVKPLCAFFIRQGRENQAAFVMDGGDELC